MTLTTLIKRNFLWVIFAGFAALAVAFKGDEPLFAASGPYAFGKYITWALFFGFLAYTIYCSNQQSFLKSIPRITKEIWVRQISIDLYIGVMMAIFLIYLNEGSLVFVLLWLIPILMFANLAVLLYVAMNYASIVSHFVS